MSLLNRVLDTLVGWLGPRREDFWDEELWVDDPLASYSPAERQCNGRSLLNRVLGALLGWLGSCREDCWDEELWVDDPLASWGPAERQCNGSERRTGVNPAATDCTALRRRRAACRLVRGYGRQSPRAPIPVAAPGRTPAAAPG